MAGSLLFLIVCLIGICFGIYFGAKAKKPCTKDKHSPVHDSSIKLNYSIVENLDSTCTNSEQEERFNHRYQPPTPLPQNNETN